MTTCVRTFSIINFGIFWKYKSGIQEFPFYSITSSLSGRQALWGATITIFIIEICLTIEFYQTIGVNLLIKYSLLLDVFLSIIEIYLSNITHHKLNTNKSINRKIAIILRAKSNRIMLKEMFAIIPNVQHSSLKVLCKKIFPLGVWKVCLSIIFYLTKSRFFPCLVKAKVTLLRNKIIKGWIIAPDQTIILGL